MFCAGLLLSIADLLVVPTAKICRLQTPSHQSTGAHEPAQYYSMFLEAFPQPQEHGGTTPLGRALQILRTRLPWVDVSTIRRSAQLFNWNLAGKHGACTARARCGLTEPAAKCRLSSTRRRRGTRFAVRKFIFHWQPGRLFAECPPSEGIRGSP